MSSIINEVTRPVLNFFYDKILHAQKAQKEYKAPKVPNNSFKLFIFFHDKILHAQKALKEYKAPKGTRSTKSTKTQPNTSIKTQISEQKLKMHLKTSKEKKVAYLRKKVSKIGILIQLN